MDFSNFGSWIKDHPYPPEEGNIECSFRYPDEWHDPNLDKDLSVPWSGINLCRTDNCTDYEGLIGIVYVECWEEWNGNDHHPVLYVLKYSAGFMYQTPMSNESYAIPVFCEDGGSGVLGCFGSKTDAVEACTEASDAISKEASEALENGGTSIYFKTAWIRGHAKATFDGVLQESEGADYEYAPEKEEKQCINGAQEKNYLHNLEDGESFIETILNTEDEDDYTVRCILMEEAFIRDVCKEINVEACCEKNSTLLIFSEEKFLMQLDAAYTNVLGGITQTVEDCYLILKALKCDGSTEQLIGEQAEEALMDWRSADNIRPSVLSYVYHQLAKKMIRIGEEW